MQLGDHLPKIYQKLLPESFLAQPVSESKAVCANCNMARQGVYHEDLKCCTYYPFLANFLVGPSVEDKVVKSLIRKKRFALPLGLVAPVAYQYEFQMKKGTDFGHRKDLLCPFYEKGKCRIWKHRSGECAAFLCESSYGSEGLRFWREVGEFLFDVEMTLSQNVLLELGFDWFEIERQLESVRLRQFQRGDDQRWALSAEDHQGYWAHWAQRESEFYVRAFECAREMGPAWLSQKSGAAPPRLW